MQPNPCCILSAIASLISALWTCKLTLLSVKQTSRLAGSYTSTYNKAHLMSMQLAWRWSGTLCPDSGVGPSHWRCKSGQCGLLFHSQKCQRQSPISPNMPLPKQHCPPGAVSIWGPTQDKNKTAVRFIEVVKKHGCSYPDVVEGCFVSDVIEKQES